MTFGTTRFARHAGRVVVLSLLVAGASAVATPAPPATWSAGPGVSASPTAPPFPDGPFPLPSEPPQRSPDPATVELLLGQIPEPIRSTCEAQPPDDELAAVTCDPAPGVTIDYRMMESPYGVVAAFDWATTFATEAGTMPGSGTCREGGYLGTWPEGGDPFGELLCYEHRGLATIVWTHEASGIIGYLDVARADHAAAYDLWLTAGPAGSGTTTPSQTPGGTP